MNLSPEEKAIGKANFQNAVQKLDSSGLSRRDFLKAGAAALAVPSAAAGAFYFGYSKVANPVRVGVIGTGDEGSVLISNISPDYLDVIAICDIRPYNQHRAFHGDESSPSSAAARQGLMKVFGWKTEDEARKHVTVYTDYKEFLKHKDLEAVIIAVPLFQHAEIASAALNAGKHVLTEKLMAHNITQCKQMGKLAREKDLLLATGHQRHYSILYDNAVQTIRNKLIGDVHHIRAQWHRGNLPGKDSWTPPLPPELLEKIAKHKAELEKTESAAARDKLLKEIRLWELQAKDALVDAKAFGYIDKEFAGRNRSALEELIRWRIWDRTGGGLMAELGSHQLDAASIFLAAARKDGVKPKPLSISAVGGRHIFPLDRECDDHVYCNYEFPAEGYQEDPNKKIVVTYSSINGNGFGDWGEVVMGTAGTLILEREQEALLYGTAGASTSVSVKADKSGKASLAAETGGAPAAAAGPGGGGGGPISRGYREEMEHWAYCIRNKAPENKPRCHPEVAMADAIIALTANLAMKHEVKIKFDENWFKIDHPDVPETSFQKQAEPVKTV